MTVRHASAQDMRSASKRRSKDADDGELDLTTEHTDMVYWYSSYEDPNCLALVELVATEVDTKRGIEVSGSVRVDA